MELTKPIYQLTIFHLEKSEPIARLQSNVVPQLGWHLNLETMSKTVAVCKAPLLVFSTNGYLLEIHILVRDLS
jgi:hypothetical protein